MTKIKNSILNKIMQMNSLDDFKYFRINCLRVIKLDKL